MVKKKNDKWKMYANFIDLNKEFPKDHFPLPRIDQLVVATTGHELLFSMDVNSGYYQIKMKLKDKESTIFITNRGTCCYNVMPLGIKNVGAIY